jgi:hypothetical protein
MSQLRCILVGLHTLLACGITAQQTTLPLQRQWCVEAERIALANDSTPIHLGEKPYAAKAITGNQEVTWASPARNFSKVGAKLLRDHAVDVKGTDYRIMADPLFDITAGRDFGSWGKQSSENIIFNQRGIQLMGNIGSKFSFQSAFYETQTLAPYYMRRIHDDIGVYPSYGRTKAFKQDGYDFAMATSLLTYAPARFITLQVGQGRQFYGHGYRSLLWSDASFVYPYAKISLASKNGKLTYSTLYAELRTLERLPKGEVPESIFKPKSASVNYLSYSPSQRIEIGLFESTIWNRYDSLGTHAPSAWAAAPIIGLHSSVVGLNALENSMLGLNLRIRITHKLSVYGQLAADDFKSNRLGFQGGLHLYDWLVKGLHLQAEYNSTSDYFYASSYDLQTVSHNNQPMGHPGGSAVKEQYLIIDYHRKRLLIELRGNRLTQSNGPSGDYTGDPNEIFQPFIAWSARTLYQCQGELSWILQPATCTSLSLGCTLRKELNHYSFVSNTKDETCYIWLGIRSHLFNSYSDF